MSNYTPEEELGRIATWDARTKADALEMLRFAHARFRGEWRHQSGGLRHRILPEWSGDWDIVHAMQRNRFWWAMSLSDIMGGRVYILDISWMDES